VVAAEDGVEEFTKVLVLGVGPGIGDGAGAQAENEHHTRCGAKQAAHGSYFLTCFGPVGPVVPEPFRRGELVPHHYGGAWCYFNRSITT
jgi:hypothetical protein